ncbi:MAG: hypothetical protein WBG89_02825 [Ornithinimicrobium sp.]
MAQEDPGAICLVAGTKKILPTADCNLNAAAQFAKLLAQLALQSPRWLRGQTHSKNIHV